MHPRGMEDSAPLQEHKRSASKYDFVKVRVWLDKPGPMGAMRNGAADSVGRASPLAPPPPSPPLPPQLPPPQLSPPPLSPPPLPQQQRRRRQQQQQQQQEQQQQQQQQQDEDLTLPSQPMAAEVAAAGVGAAAEGAAAAGVGAAAEGAAATATAGAGVGVTAATAAAAAAAAAAATTAAQAGTHHYILSRYLLCRSLECIQIPTAVARTMSLQLKKTLVDLGLLDIPQSLLETYLHKIMAMFGYRERHVARYHMVLGFQSRRIPLVVLLSGTAWIGKSTMANKLADRLNLPNVLQTGTVFELMSTLTAAERSGATVLAGTDANRGGEGGSAYATAAPCWEREWHGDDRALLAAYEGECALVREGVESDIEKGVRDGKALIVVGTHLDPAMYRHRLVEAGIVLRIVLTLGEDDHRHFIKCTSSHHPQHRNLPCWFHNVRVIEQQLVQRCGGSGGGGHVGKEDAVEEHPVVEMKMNIHSFTETIDALHTAILERIDGLLQERNVR